MEASSGDEEAMCWEEEGDGDGVEGSSTVEGGGRDEVGDVGGVEPSYSPSVTSN
jgi:hypothetical protein